MVTFNDPEEATRFVVMAVGRQAGVRLQATEIDFLNGQLVAAHAKIDPEDVETYSNAVVALVDKLAPVLEAAAYPGGRIHTRSLNQPVPSGLPSGALRQSFLSICPLWPFC